MNEDAARWLKQAFEDIATAKILLDAGRFGPCAFFSQQAAEKALKAVLYAVGERPWGHSVASLLDQVAIVTESKIDEDLQCRAQALDEHYIRPRYPDARSEIDEAYDSEAAQDALNDAQNVVEFAQTSINNATTTSDDEPTTDLG